jgi:hypothetical protein
MSNLARSNQPRSIDLGNGETITSEEFFRAIYAQAPLALQHESWLYLAKMAFMENRVDALQMAKKQAIAIQQQGNSQRGTMQAFPTTYPTTYPAAYPQPQPQPIIFSPQITVNPTIAPTFQGTNTANPSNTTTTPTRETRYYYDDGTPSSFAVWLGLFFATTALVVLVVG